MAEESKFLNLRLNTAEQLIVETVAQEYEGNKSLAVRHMIRTYGKEHLAATPDNGGQVVERVEAGK